MTEAIKKLLSECDIQFYRSASGPGGQNVNKTATAVRLHHRPTGMKVESKSHRSQYRNKVEAAKRLQQKLNEAAREETPRIPTEPSDLSKEKRLKKKKEQSGKKQARKPVRWED